MNQANDTSTISEKIDCYKKIIALDPHDPRAFHSLGDVYSSFDEVKSKMYWEMAVQRYSEKIESFNDSASEYLKRSDNSELPKIESKDVFREVGQYFYNLGEIHYNLHKYSQATDAYKKALKMDSTQVDCLYDLAMSLFHEKKFEESKKYLLEFLSKQSSYAGHYYLGLIFAGEGYVKEALGEFWNCIELTQDDSVSDYYRGMSYHHVGNMKLCEKYLKLSIAKDPEDLETIHILIKLYESNGEGQKAYEYYEQIRSKKETLRSMRDTM
ncbi:MAG: tetratricopeptide repeat protein [Thaumarchaeota archaeon]|nr:tetratricopeptide repeat protein [Nitrososphaerota archaeon]